MATKRFPWMGFIIGFLFGTLGMWILAMLSLAVPFIELISGPLFALGRYVAQFLEEDGSAGTGAVIVLMLVNGVFYGLVGMGIQFLLRATKK